MPLETPPSGTQYVISAGDYRAVAVEVGGGVRELTRGDRPVLDGYAEDAIADGGRGQVLAPWPNRLRGGEWSFGGRDMRLALSEPAAGNAIHGLVRWAGWAVDTHETSRVVLRHRLHPHPGYPFTLDLAAEYALDADSGLTATLSVTNVGPSPAPVAWGVHPYLSAGGGLVDGCELVVPADTRVRTDAGIPVDTESVDGTAYDFRSARAIGNLHIDDTYTGLRPDDDGLVRVVLRAPDGLTRTLWMDGAHRWAQIYTGDTLVPARRRQGVAVEPMTAPANALATGEGLVVLEPGRTHRGTWGVRAD